MLKKHKRKLNSLKRDCELTALIDEQQKELKAESCTAYIRGLKNNFQKGKKGVFVGNRIF